MVQHHQDDRQCTQQIKARQVIGGEFGWSVRLYDGDGWRIYRNIAEVLRPLPKRCDDPFAVGDATCSMRHKDVPQTTTQGSFQWHTESFLKQGAHHLRCYSMLPSDHFPTPT